MIEMNRRNEKIDINDGIIWVQISGVGNIIEILGIVEKIVEEKEIFICVFMINDSIQLMNFVTIYEILSKIPVISATILSNEADENDVIFSLFTDYRIFKTEAIISLAELQKSIPSIDVNGLYVRAYGRKKVNVSKLEVKGFSYNEVFIDEAKYKIKALIKGKSNYQLKEMVRFYVSLRNEDKTEKMLERESIVFTKLINNGCKYV